LLRRDLLNHLDIGNLGEGDLDLSGNGLRVGNGLVDFVLFYLFEGNIPVDGAGADLVDILEDNLGDLASLRDLYKVGFLVLLVDKVLLGHLDGGLTVNNFRDSPGHGFLTDLLFSGLSEHLDGLELFNGGCASAGGVAASAASLALACTLLLVASAVAIRAATV